MLNIPARVNIGFTPGTRDGDGWRVTVHDAHAWPELWFNGVGWLPFEPTPRNDGQVQQPSYSVPPLPSKGQPSTRPSASARPSASPSTRTQSKLEPDSPSTAAKGGARSGTATSVLALAALVIALLVGALPGTARRLTRRRRWVHAETPAAAAHAAWAELRDTMHDLGLPWDRTQTPRAVARQLSAQLAPADGGTTPAAAALRRVGAAEERARYARPTDPGTAVTSLHQDSDLVLEALRRSVGRRSRLRAMLVPRSVLVASLHAVTGAIADVLDGVDAVFAALGRWGRRALHPLRG